MTDVFQNSEWYEKHKNKDILFLLHMKTKRKAQGFTPFSETTASIDSCSRSRKTLAIDLGI